MAPCSIIRRCRSWLSRPARIEENAENIDSMTLSAPYNHPYLSAIRPLASTIVCKKGNAIVFEGRALDNGTDFYNTHTWTCESCLAYLKDSIQPLYSYKGTLRGLLEQFITEHNAAVEEKKQFVLGNVTVTDDNDYISYSSTEFTVTLDAIREKLINTHGGYLRVRYVGETKYLDYIADFDSLSAQTVEFGKNLLDVKISRDHTERVSVLLPLGAKIKETDAEGNEYETGERVQITSVNGGKNYIVDQEAAAEIGMIWKTEIWEDVTIPGSLLRKAQARLHDLVQGVTSIRYDRKPIISGITLNIPERTTTAIVGPSGGGKTTLCHLLARFWDVDGGRVTLGGRDVREYDMGSLMRNFSFVFQNVYLFHDTVANNIRFGQSDVPMEKVVAAAKKARCHDFIMKLPLGYETVIGEAGG